MRFLHLLCLLGIYSATFSQNSNPFIAHEWGTFTMLSTAGGELLEGLTRSEELLPEFVHQAVQPYRYYDNYDKSWVTSSAKAIDVNARMETPVIYFYSDRWRSMEVEVILNRGTSTEWFPKCNTIENFLTQPGWTLHESPFGNWYTINLSNGYRGTIRWKFDVLNPATYQNVSYPDSLNNTHWNAPRSTQSNLVKRHNEIEKFIFYRGIAHLKDLPLRTEFNTAGNLVIKNTTQETLPYIAVYEEKNGNDYLYWTGPLYPGSHQVVQMNSFSCQNCLNDFQDEFTKQLIASGLYKDEARAMLKTWDQSYFHSPGIKVFWVMPRSYIDPTLQLVIDPRPDQLERVFVGRTEILTPEFEEYLLSFDSEGDLKQHFENDRFLEAYQDFYDRGRLSELSNILESDNAKPKNQKLIKHKISAWPNPTTGSYQSHLEPKPMLYQYPLTLKVIDGQGQIIHREYLHDGTTAINQSLDGFPEGIYFLTVTSNDTRWFTTIVKH